jgi:hypothetical protein
MAFASRIEGFKEIALAGAGVSGLLLLASLRSVGLGSVPLRQAVSESEFRIGAQNKPT